MQWQYKDHVAPDTIKQFIYLSYSDIAHGGNEGNIQIDITLDDSSTNMNVISIQSLQTGAYCSGIPLMLRAHLVKDSEGKAGRKTSTAKDLKSVFRPLTRTPLIKPSVPCMTIVLPVTCITSK
jgi:hypothetical protein